MKFGSWNQAEIDPKNPPPDLAAEAKRHPGGWVYVIDGTFGPGERVPPQVIKSAWKVDDAGNLTGEYRANPNYVAGWAEASRLQP